MMNLLSRSSARVGLILGLLLPAGCGASPLPTHAVPSEQVEEYGDQDYALLLSEHVDAQGFVDYAGLKEDRELLDRFVAQVARLDPAVFTAWPQEARLAFWINAYNALTLKAVVDHYPVESIKEIGTLLRSVWDKLTFDVMGRTLTLNDIEHTILRKEFDEPRIHMAINCASIGCPPLLNEPFRADALEGQLEKQSREFVNTGSKFRIDRARQKVLLSPIFDWFGDDFIARYGQGPDRPEQSEKQKASIRFISRYVPDTDRAYLDEAEYTVGYLGYDWGLNTQ